MKPTTFALILGGLLCFGLYPGKASGYAYSSDVFASVGGLTNYDTADLNISFRDNGGFEQLVCPRQYARLNYTQIMFEHSQVSGADEYVLEVALDDGTNSFADPLFTQIDSSLATMLGNFEFGKKYIWRYTGLQNHRGLGWNGPYHFEILNSPLVDKSRFKVNVLKNDSVHNCGGLVTLDLSGNIIDRNGNFVWFYPTPAGVMVNNTLQGFVDLHNSDMQLTPAGTITSIINHRAIDCGLNGNPLWQAPKRISSAADSGKYVTPYAFHHCFKRLATGNYMVIDQDNIAIADSLLAQREVGVPFNIVAKSNTGKTIVVDEIIKEFNPAGKMVWSWSSENYFDNAELAKLVQTKPDPGLLHPEPGGHMNAFDVDEKNGFVYAGFRNVSRVIKIDKATGQVLCAWGDNIKSRGSKNGEGLFLKQHGTTLLRDGSLAVYNNNPKPALAPGETAASEVVVFTQPVQGAASKVTWKYSCNFSTGDNMGSVSGNVDELKNGSLLVCMGAVNRIFEITRNKKITWNAVVEAYNTFDSTWKKFPLYRAHFTSSLYPCYFTVQTTSKGIKIFNDGTENDSYLVNIPSASGTNSEFSTVQVHAKSSLSLPVKPGAQGASPVTITSKTNPAFKRVVYIK